jgi:hypothetical protein
MLFCKLITLNLPFKLFVKTVSTSLRLKSKNEKFKKSTRCNIRKVSYGMRKKELEVGSEKEFDELVFRNKSMAKSWLILNKLFSEIVLSLLYFSDNRFRWNKL